MATVCSQTINKLDTNYKSFGYDPFLGHLVSSRCTYQSLNRCSHKDGGLAGYSEANHVITEEGKSVVMFRVVAHSRSNYKKHPPKIPSVITDIYIDFPYKSEAFLRENYCQKQHSITYISKLCMSSRDTIKLALISHNIDIREDDIMTRGPVQFGKRRIKAKEIDNKREQQIVALITELREQNLSYQKIADDLNSKGIKSKKKGIWHAMTVRKVYQRTKPVHSITRF